MAKVLWCAYEIPLAVHFKQGVTEIYKGKEGFFFQTINTQPSTGWSMLLVFTLRLSFHDSLSVYLFNVFVFVDMWAKEAVLESESS